MKSLQPLLWFLVVTLAPSLGAAPVRATNGVYFITNPPASVAVAWDLEADPTTSYNVYYGSASLTYTNVISVGTTNYCAISNLVFGATYYFACTAVLTNGLESAYSAEISWTVPGLPPPPANDKLTNKVVSIQFRNTLGDLWADSGVVLFLDPQTPTAFYRLTLK